MRCSRVPQVLLLPRLYAILELLLRWYAVFMEVSKYCSWYLVFIFIEFVKVSVTQIAPVALLACIGELRGNLASHDGREDK